MLLIQSGAVKAARKWSVVMAVTYALATAFGALMTMHFYVRPRPPVPPGFRLFGFPRPRR